MELRVNNQENTQSRWQPVSSNYGVTLEVQRRFEINTLQPKALRSKPFLSPRQTKTFFQFSKSLISELDLGKKVEGTKTGKAKPIHLNRKSDIREVYRRRHLGWKASHQHSWKKRDIERHCRGEVTLYYAGSHERWKTHTLVMIDIDCHGGGSLEGAVAFAQMLKEEHFKNLYYEPSTNGSGIHCYLILDKWGG